MVLLYLTSQQNADTLDKECAAKGIIVKKMTGHFNLNRFVVRDGSSLGSFSYLAIDLDAIQDSEDEIVRALNGFRAMHSAQVIVVTHGMMESDPFLIRLRGEGVRCVASHTEVVPEQAPKEEYAIELISELAQVPEPVPEREHAIDPVQASPPPVEPIPEPGLVSEPPSISKALPKTKRIRKTKPIPETEILRDPQVMPIQEQDAIPEPESIPISAFGPLPRPVFSPTRQSLSIGICGAIHRVGATTQALNIAVYLSRQSYTACVVEANAHGHIGQLVDFYGMRMDKDNGRISHNGIDLYLQYDLSAMNRFGYTATVFDYGMFEGMDAHSFFARDVKIICAGAKAWESPALGEVFTACGGRNDLHFMFSFAPQDEQRDVKELMGKYSDNTHFSAYLPSLFEPLPNADVYHAMLAPYIQTAKQNEPPRKGLFSRGR